jgi:TatA/E family protein of Tat protein translocase
MPFDFGIGEIAIVLVIGLLVFGPKKLPEISRSIGSGMRDFRKGLAGEVEASVAQTAAPAAEAAAPVAETPVETPAAAAPAAAPTPAAAAPAAAATPAAAPASNVAAPVE